MGQMKEECLHQEELINKLNKEKKSITESKMKEEEQIQSFEDKCNHLNKLKIRLEKSLDEVEDSWEREVQVPRVPLPAFLPRNGVLRSSRDCLQLHHEVRRRHQEGPVRQHCPLRWHHHVPRYCRQNAEGDHRSCPLHHQDQDYRSP